MRWTALAALMSLSLPALAADIVVPTGPDLALHAQIAGKGPRAILLLHDDGRSSSDFAPLAKRLEDTGFQVMALDLRGHGASPGTLDEAGYAAMGDDIDKALALLESKGAEQIAIVGAGLGANLGLHAASKHPTVAGVALLSPKLSAQGYRSTTAIAAYGDRPIWLAAGEADSSGARAVSTVASRATGKAEVNLFDTAAKGTQLFNQGARIEASLMGWLTQLLAVGGPNPAAQALDAQVADEVQTTGRNFGD